ncbi:hypothetical protein Br6_05013 [Rhodococcus sp. Br-6]|nr:hypothetical protein Br6_05013 [Rhodococcus sp. Br-6]
MDFPPIYWLMPAIFFSDEVRQWVTEHAPCWLGGWCP